MALGRLSVIDRVSGVPLIEGSSGHQILVIGSAGHYGSGIPRGMHYVASDLIRIAHATWDVQHLVPHADDEPTWGNQIREFHRALEKLSPLEPEPKK